MLGLGLGLHKNVLNNNYIKFIVESNVTFDPTIYRTGTDTAKWVLGDGTELTGNDISHNYTDNPPYIGYVNSIDFKTITELNMPEDGLSYLSTSGLNNLVKLVLNDNNLYRLDLSKFKSLEDAEISDNAGLIDIGNISNLTSLDRLRMTNCNMSFFYDISKLTLLTYLNVSFNNLNAYALDRILIDLDTAGASNGTLFYNDNQDSPTAESLTAYNSLIGKGWSITGTVPVSTNLYFVDATNGDDANGGTSIVDAYKTMDKVNSTTFTTGDTVYFTQDTYREKLSCQEGVSYRGYSYIASKPLILGSIDASNSADWSEISPDIWQKNFLSYDSVVDDTNLITNGDFEVDTLNWQFNATPPGLITASRDAVDFQVGASSAKMIRNEGESAGTGSIQIYTYPIDSNPGFTVSQNKVYKLSYWAKATTPFTFENTKLMMKSDPRVELSAYITNDTPTITNGWVKYESIIYCNLGHGDTQIRWQMGNTFLEGNTLNIDDVRLELIGENAERPVDVGAIIGDDSTMISDLQNNVGDVDAEGRFHYDIDAANLTVYSTSNPAVRFNSLEVFDKGNMIITSFDDVRVNNLELKYGGGHGIYINNLSNNTVDYCKITFIGGAYLRYATSWLRYGNAIEMWKNSDGHKIEHNFIDQIYDTGITFQGDNETTTLMTNITIEYNTIKRCGLANFEFWQSTGTTSNISYQYNISENAGYGWGGDVRPDPDPYYLEGNDIMQFQNSNTISNFNIKYNTFRNSKGDVYTFSNDNDLIDCDWNNIIKDEDSILCRYEGTFVYYMSADADKDIYDWRTDRRKDINSTFSIIDFWTPAQITTALWLDASRPETITENVGVPGNVAQWNDLSGNNNHALQGTEANQPTYADNKIIYDGTDRYLNVAHGVIPDSDENSSVFFVGKANGIQQGFLSNGKYNQMNQSYSIKTGTDLGELTWYSWGGDLDVTLDTNVNNLNLYGVDLSVANSSVNVYQNGNLNGTLSSFTGVANAGTELGRIGKSYLLEYLSGNLNEIIIIKDVISTETRQKIEGYLQAKWNTPALP